MKFVVYSHVKLNETGWAGVVLLIAGPIAAALSFIMFMNASQYEAQTWAFLSAIASVAPFAGYVMFTLGRETISTALSGEDAKSE